MKSRFLCLALTALLLTGLVGTALGAEVSSDSVYCFCSEDFSSEDAPISGICITGLPDAEAGTILLGNRVLRPGDILTAQQVEQMTFVPLRTEADNQAQMTYLPIYENRVASTACMTISIRGKKDKEPAAQDMALETYKNLPAEGMLKVSDPEGQALTYTLVRGPKRGSVELREDGSFTYTPKKNKVGVDSFVYTAADPAGNVSREATVTLQILKPTDGRQYVDTLGSDCRFAAEWMRNTGLFVGETVSGESFFYPEKAVSRGEFLAMVVKTLDLPAQDVAANLPADTPQWLKPYLTAAIRSGLTENWVDTETGAFLGNAPITGAEAAALLQNALALPLSLEAVETSASLVEDAPVWAAEALTALQSHGICLSAQEQLTRADAAKALYQTSQLAVTAPGMAVFHMD